MRPADGTDGLSPADDDGWTGSEDGGWVGKTGPEAEV